jgi:hypothetical protein
LFSTGLANVAKIGAGVTEGLMGIADEKTALGVRNYYLQKYHAATTDAARKLVMDEYLMKFGKGLNENIAVNTPTTTAEAVK